MPHDANPNVGDEAATKAETISVNSGIDASPAPAAVDRIAEAVEFATPKGPARTFFAKAKSLRGPALARAYPLYLLLKGNPEGTNRLLAKHKFPHRKRQPNRSNTALIAVMIALNPANEDDHADCCEEAYALRAFAERGVPARDFEDEYNATTILACKQVVRSAKCKSSPIVEPTVEEFAADPVSSDVKCSGRPFFIAYYMAADRTLTLSRMDAPENFQDVPISEMPEREFLDAYLQFLLKAQRQARLARVLPDPDEEDMTLAATSATSP